MPRLSAESWTRRWPWTRDAAEVTDLKGDQRIHSDMGEAHIRSPYPSNEAPLDFPSVGVPRLS